MSSEDKDDKKAEEKTGNGKWWEFYIVRYALGTVFGVLIVNFLVGSGLAIPFPNGNISDITKPEGLPLLLGYGLAYCYLASAPILVFHAGRFAMKRTGFQTATVISIVISAVVAGAWAAWAVNAIGSRSLYVLACLTIGMVMFLICLQGRSLFYGFGQASQMWAFYKKLDINRRVKDNRELIDSYRHLREHGNAFFVVLLELLLGLGLYMASKVSVIPPSVISSCAASDKSCNSDISIALLQTVLLILIWIIPAAMVWAIGCILEAEFSMDSSIGPSAASVTTTTTIPSVPSPAASPTPTPTVTTPASTPPAP